MPLFQDGLFQDGLFQGDPEPSVSLPGGLGPRVQTAFVRESVFGTIPTNTTWKIFRVVSGGMGTNVDSSPSLEARFRGTRRIDASAEQVNGSYAFEFTNDSFDDLLESAFCNSWFDDTLKDGKQLKSLAVEDGFISNINDISYSRFNGVVVNSLSLNITSRQKIQGSVSLIGLNETFSNTILSGVTYTPAPNTPLLSASKVADLSISTFNNAPIIRAINLQIDNSIAAGRSKGSLKTKTLRIGSLSVSGLMACYFESNELYRTALNRPSLTVEFTIGHYTVTIPKLKFDKPSRDIGGNSDDIMVNIAWRALYDQTQGCHLMINRNPVIVPYMRFNDIANSGYITILEDV